MRCLGLTDPSSSVYNAWRVPNPTAPYPQDYIIDQQGRVAHWDDQFDPQKVMNVIARLLGAGLEADGAVQIPNSGIVANPNPFRSRTAVSLRLAAAGCHAVTVYSAAGRPVRTLSATQRSHVYWDGRDEAGREVPAGIYYCCRVPSSRRARSKLVKLD